MGDVTVRKRPGSDKWEYRIELARINGKRQQKSKGGFKTKAEAIKAGREALNEYENGGQITTPSEISVSDMLDQWLAEWRKTDLKQVTAEGYAKKIRLYIKPVIGMYRAKAITRQNLQDLITSLADQGYSKNTVSSVRGILTNAFDWAEINKLIPQTPAFRLKMPKNTEIKQRTDPHVYIKPDQIKMIFDRFPAGSTPHLPMMIAYHCGLRLGEVYALTWDDIDLDNKLLAVNRQVQWRQDRMRTQKEKKDANGSSEGGNGYWYFSPPKYDSYRVIELDMEITELLSKEKDRQARSAIYYDNLYTHYYTAEKITLAADNHADDPLINKISTSANENEIQFVCRRENGEYITPRTMQHTSWIIHHKLDFPEFDFHSLRHTHATMLRDNGAPDIYIQRRLGHAKVETTTQIYTNHLTDAARQQGNSVLQNMY